MVLLIMFYILDHVLINVDYLAYMHSPEYLNLHKHLMTCVFVNVDMFRHACECVTCVCVNVEMSSHARECISAYECILVFV